MKTMFWTYAAFVVVGLAYFLAVSVRAIAT